MPLIFNDKHARRAAQLASASALRATNEAVDQLQAQLKAEREQHRFNMAQKGQELATLGRELAEAPLEIAQRDRRDALLTWEPETATRH